MKKNETVQEKRSDEEITTRKTAACAVALGVGIIRELVGKEISTAEDVNDNEMMAASISSELQL